MVLVRQRTQLKNRIHATLAKYGLHDFEVSDLFGVHGRALWRQRLTLLPPHTAYATQQLLEQIEKLDGGVRGFEQRIEAVFKPTPAIQWLLTLPGVGRTLAVVIASREGMSRGSPPPRSWPASGHDATRPRQGREDALWADPAGRQPLPQMGVRRSGERDLPHARAHAAPARQSPLRSGRSAQGPREGHRGGGPASGRSDVLDVEQRGVLSRTERRRAVSSTGDQRGGSMSSQKLDR